MMYRAKTKRDSIPRVIFVLISTCSLVLLGLTGCSFSNPEGDRDQKIRSIEQALTNGDGEALCVALNTAVPDSCAQPILSSSGLGEVDIADFALTETRTRHSFAVNGFSLILESERIEFENGPEYLFNLVELKVPSVELPFGGNLAETVLSPGEEYRVMPALVPVDLKPSEPAHGFYSVSLMTKPWTNQYQVILDWSPNLEALMKSVLKTECPLAFEESSYEIFKSSSFSSEYLNSDSLFRRAETYIDTYFEDATAHDGEVRVINSPRGLRFDACEFQDLTIEETRVTATWLANASFEGTVGVKKSRNTFGDDYTGRYKKLNFETVVAGSTYVDFSFDLVKPEIGTSEIRPRLPLKTTEG